MDAFLLTKSLERETYVNVKPKMSLMSAIELFIFLPISIFAAFLAWNAGSSDSALLRVFMTIFAFMFSLVYIIGYVIFKGFKAIFHDKPFQLIIVL